MAVAKKRREYVDVNDTELTAANVETPSKRLRNVTSSVMDDLSTCMLDRITKQKITEDTHLELEKKRLELQSKRESKNDYCYEQASVWQNAKLSLISVALSSKSGTTWNRYHES